MSFYFNWGCLDETAAEAIQLLINNKLEQILDEKLKAMSTSDNCDPNKINTCVGGLGGGSSILEGNRSRGRAYNLDTEHGSPGTRSGLTGPSVVNTQLHPTLIDTTLHKASSFSIESGTNSDFKHQAPQYPGRHVSQGLSTPPSASVTTGTAGGTSLHPSVAPKKIPLITFLCINSIKWGTTPPFIEIERFENAIDILDTTIPVGSAASLNINIPVVGTSDGQTDRPFCDHLDSTEEPQVVCVSSTIPLQRDGTLRGKAPTSAGGTSDTASMAIPQEPFDNMNNISATRAPEEVRGLSTKSSVLSHLKSTRMTSPQSRFTPTIQLNKIKTPRNYSEQELPTSSSTSFDTLAPFLGAGGLYLRLHLTYGGSMSFSASTAIQYCINIGSFSLPVYMPIELQVSDFDLDCFVCFNFHHNECRLWLEPGKLADSVINRLKVVAVFGERKDKEDDLDSSATDLLRNNGSRIYDDDGSIFVDKREVEQLVVSEVKSFLQKKLMAPHFISIPIQLSG
ncbi:unnamed protein product [Phytomonas sp. Hart1]|nr:unnamed protein product [Phytomonas sp. Hart1]|eukprot:CCW68656.1 unnamed protein product [Phytomonas sp. isolate Hart1]